MTKDRITLGLIIQLLYNFYAKNVGSCRYYYKPRKIWNRAEKGNSLKDSETATG